MFFFTTVLWSPSIYVIKWIYFLMMLWWAHNKGSPFLHFYQLYLKFCYLLSILEGLFHAIGFGIVKFIWVLIWPLDSSVLSLNYAKQNLQKIILTFLIL